MVKTISSRSSSRLSEQVDDQGMRDGKGAHTIRDSCYHKQEGAESVGGGEGWQQTRQWQDRLPTSKIYITCSHFFSILYLANNTHYITVDNRKNKKRKRKTNYN